MRVKALESFGGRIHMRQGEERELEDVALIRDLKKAGYIEMIDSFKEEKMEEGQQEPEEEEGRKEPEEEEGQQEPENQAEAKGQQEQKDQPEQEVSNSDTGKRKRKKAGKDSEDK